MRPIFGKTARFNRSILVRLFSVLLTVKLFWLGFGQLYSENLDVHRYFVFITAALLFVVLVIKARDI